MSEQNYNNHVRYYTQHHFVFYPLVLIMSLVCGYGLYSYPGQRLLWATLLILTLLLCHLSLMLRQHYALIHQNRIIKLELRFRYYAITRQRFEPLEAQLSDSQIYALRFAPDEELPALAQRAVKEQLTGDAIKRAIKHWKADEMRV